MLNRDASFAVPMNAVKYKICAIKMFNCRCSYWAAEEASSQPVQITKQSVGILQPTEKLGSVINHNKRIAFGIEV